MSTEELKFHIHEAKYTLCLTSYSCVKIPVKKALFRPRPRKVNQLRV